MLSGFTYGSALGFTTFVIKTIEAIEISLLVRDLKNRGARRWEQEAAALITKRT